MSLANRDLIAIDDFSKAISINPKYSAYIARGMTYYKQGLYDLAISDYTKAISKKPEYSVSYYNRSLALFNKGEYETALKDCEKALKVEPENKAYRKHLEILLKNIEETKLPELKEVEKKKEQRKIPLIKKGISSKPPEVNLYKFINNRIVYNSDYELTGQASGENEVVTVEVIVNGNKLDSSYLNLKNPDNDIRKVEFKALISLKKGENEIVVKAVDSAGLSCETNSFNFSLSLRLKKNTKAIIARFSARVGSSRKKLRRTFIIAEASLLAILSSAVVN